MCLTWDPSLSCQELVTPVSHSASAGPVRPEAFLHLGGSRLVCPQPLLFHPGPPHRFKAKWRQEAALQQNSKSQNRVSEAVPSNMTLMAGWEQIEGDISPETPGCRGPALLATEPAWPGQPLAVQPQTLPQIPLLQTLALVNTRQPQGSPGPVYPASWRGTSRRSPLRARDGLSAPMYMVKCPRRKQNKNSPQES